jgi:tripartite-type tricarboxylate transporter receptor subunit TctC
MSTWSGPLRGEGAYPNRPITMVVPLAVGASADLVARLLAQDLSDQLKQPIKVDNRTGAGTIVGATSVARGPRDGYTLLFAPSGTLAINPALYNKLLYDPAVDLVPIAHVSNVPLVLVTAHAAPFDSVPDLITWARAHPAKIVVASSGIGTANHLAAELFQEAAGVAFIHAPYRESTAGLRDVVAGHVQLMFADAGAALPLIMDGKLRALAVSSKMPLAAARKIPPLASFGFDEFDVSSWHMLVGPGGMPPEVMQRLNGAVTVALSKAGLRNQIESLGLNVASGADPERLRSFLDQERRRWAKVLQRLGLAGSQ